MHEPVRRWVANQTGPDLFARVIEVGGRNLNGGVRDLINAAEYLSVDLYAGPDVDVVANVVEWAATGQDPAELVVCCEVLEHAPDADKVTAACADLTAPGGMLLITCATDPRSPHSGIDATPLQPGEYYQNVRPDDLVGWLRDAGMTVTTVDTTSSRGDLYVRATREGAT